MAIESPCSGCGQKLSVSEEYAGRQARCPSCGQIYTVPMPPGPSTSNLYNTSGGPSEESQPLQSPSAAPGGPIPSQSATPEAPASPAFGETSLTDSYWMKAEDGNEYGPVDRAKLDNWFREGRVGPGYQIKQGESGGWQPASVFQPQSSNPYSVASTQPTVQPTYGPGNTTGFAKPDPSGLVLTMGILAWILTFFCGVIGWIPGLVAWVAGRSALKDIQSGAADPTNLGLVQVGYYLGMINVLLTLLGVMAFGAILAIGIIAG